MPTISLFYGIAIRMFVKEHNPPHFHAVYGEYEGQIDIATGQLINGRLPKAALRLVREWQQLHRDDLMANWDRRAAGQAMQEIAGLDADEGR